MRYLSSYSGAFGLRRRCNKANGTWLGGFTPRARADDHAWYARRADKGFRRPWHWVQDDSFFQLPEPERLNQLPAEHNTRHAIKQPAAHQSGCLIKRWIRHDTPIIGQIALQMQGVTNQQLSLTGRHFIGKTLAPAICTLTIQLNGY